MRADTEYLWFETKRRRELVRITGEVAKVVERSGVQEGMGARQRRKRVVIKVMGE